MKFGKDIYIYSISYQACQIFKGCQRCETLRFLRHKLKIFTTTNYAQNVCLNPTSLHISLALSCKSERSEEKQESYIPPRTSCYTMLQCITYKQFTLFSSQQKTIQTKATMMVVSLDKIWQYLPPPTANITYIHAYKTSNYRRKSRHTFFSIVSNRLDW